MIAEMTSLFLLFLIGIGVSLYVGWKLGYSYYVSKLTNEVKDKFMQNYYNRFLTLYNQKVEERAFEIASKIVEEYFAEQERKKQK